jgi:hypothetical protein
MGGSRSFNPPGRMGDASRVVHEGCAPTGRHPITGARRRSRLGPPDARLPVREVEPPRIAPGESMIPGLEGPVRILRPAPAIRRLLLGQPSPHSPEGERRGGVQIAQGDHTILGQHRPCSLVARIRSWGPVHTGAGQQHAAEAQALRMTQWRGATCRPGSTRIGSSRVCAHCCCRRAETRTACLVGVQVVIGRGDPTMRADPHNVGPG